MHYALSERKRLLHYQAEYDWRVKTPNERLRFAREKAGYATAVEAADALGVPRSTYIGHENGHRGFPAKQAPKYARKFKVSEEWLLYAKGGQEDPLEPSADDLVRMLDEALDELPIELKRADLPRIVAPILHEQLTRFRADRVAARSRVASTSPDTAAQSPTPTKPGAQA